MITILTLFYEKETRNLHRKKVILYLWPIAINHFLIGIILDTKRQLNIYGSLAVTLLEFETKDHTGTLKLRASMFILYEKKYKKLRIMNSDHGTFSLINCFCHLLNNLQTSKASFIDEILRIFNTAIMNTVTSCRL